MTRKKILKISIIAIALLALIIMIFPQKERAKGSFSELVVSDETAGEIMSGRTYQQNMEPDIYFGGEKLFYDTNAGAYYYSLIDGNKNAYDPLVAVKSSFPNVEVAFVNGNINEESISSNESIRFLVYDGNSYCEKSLVCTTLPVLSINSQSEIGDVDVPMEVRLFDNREVSDKRDFTSEGTVRLRGNTTKIFPKKSFKINLKKDPGGDNERNVYVSLLGMRADNDWVLTACYNDRDKVRNLFSHNLWTYSCGNDNAYNLQTGIEFKFVELMVNGQYWGLYILGYKPDTKTLGENIHEKDYFYKVDYLLSGFRHDEDIKPINDYYTALEDHGDDNEYLKQALDLDNAIDFNLFVTLIQGSDNILKNYYVLLAGNDDEKRAVYVPWDLDRSWGDEFSPAEKNQTAYYKLAPDENMFFTDNGLYQLLFNGDEQTWDMLFEKYESLRNGGWSDETVNKMLDEYESDIFGSGAYLREKERWPEADYNEENNMSVFKDFVHERFSEMDELMDTLQNYRSENPFITQSLLNRQFEDSVIVVEINDRWILEDARYREFLEYIGVDVSRISDDTRYILTDFGGRNAEYYPGGLSEEESLDTGFGLLHLVNSELENYEYDEDYSIFLDDVKCYNSSDSTADPIIVAAVSKDRVRKLNMDDGYRIQYDMNYAPQDLELILELMDNMGGYILLQVNNLNLDHIKSGNFLRRFDIDYGPYSSLEEVIGSCSEMVLLLDSDRRTGYLMSDPYVSGSVHDTPMGQYAYYASETDYGIYMDGSDILTGSVDELYENEVVITVFSKDFEQLSKYEF